MGKTRTEVEKRDTALCRLEKGTIRRLRILAAYRGVSIATFAASDLDPILARMESEEFKKSRTEDPKPG